MNPITTVGALQECVDFYLQRDAFAIDTETVPQDPAISAHRLDPMRNRVMWVTLATQGRADAIPLGHPHGEFVRHDFPLTAAGERRVAEGKAPLKTSYSRDVRKATSLWTPAPPQISWPEAREVLRPLLFSDRLKVGQNIKFDIKSLAKHFGGEIMPPPYADTGIAGFLLDVRNRGRLDLASIVSREVEYTMTKGVGKEIEAHSFSVAARYAWLDVRYTWLAWRSLAAQIAESDLENLWRLEMDVLDVVIRMEHTGAPVAVGRLRELDTYLRERIDDCTAEIWRIAGRPVNLDSNVELSTLLYSPKSDGGCGIKPRMLTDGGEKKRLRGEDLLFRDYSVAEQALAAYAGKHEIVDRLLEYSTLKKLHGGFVLPYLGGRTTRTIGGRVVQETKDTLLVGDRLYGTFKQDGAETGRFSSSRPNLQNVPVHGEDAKRIRALFSVEEMEGFLIVQADYSQIEPRILTDLSEEPALLASYAEGTDVYTALAEPFGLSRQAGKLLFLSVAYGTGPETLAHAVGIPLASAKNIIYEQFPARFVNIDVLKKKTVRRARRQNPPCVRTILGRRRYLPELNSRDMARRRRAERQAFNTLIQGSAADVMKVALVQCDDAIRPLGGRLFATVHDEVLVLAPEDRAEEISARVRESMEGVKLLSKVALVADVKIVRNWAEAKD